PGRGGGRPGAGRAPSVGAPAATWAGARPGRGPARFAGAGTGGGAALGAGAFGLEAAGAAPAAAGEGALPRASSSSGGMTTVPVISSARILVITSPVRPRAPGPREAPSPFLALT